MFQSDKHQPLLVQMLCDELNVSQNQLLDFDLHLADTQPAVSDFFLLKKVRIYLFNPLPEDKILDWSKLEQIAEDILKCI